MTGRQHHELLLALDETCRARATSRQRARARAETGDGEQISVSARYLATSFVEWLALLRLQLGTTGPSGVTGAGADRLVVARGQAGRVRWRAGAINLQILGNVAATFLAAIIPALRAIR